MTTDTARAALNKAVEEAIEAFMAVMREENDDWNNVMAVDATLLVGVQWIDDEGDRCGDIGVTPRHGSQPYYTTLGLLDGARAKILNTTHGDS